MRNVFSKKEIRQIGIVSVNTKRLSRLLHYLKYRHAVAFEAFFMENGKCRLNATEFEENEALQTFVSDLIEQYLDDTLWFYEGTYLFNRALRLLSIRPRSRKEIYDFLKLHADNAKSILLIEERLKPFLNDKDFAEFLVLKERSHNPKGDRVIRMKLQEKGIDEDIVDEVLGANDVDTIELIRKQYEKKRDSLLGRIKRKGSGNIEREFAQKMRTYLFSKGFSLADIDKFFHSHDIAEHEEDYSSPDT